MNEEQNKILIIGLVLTVISMMLISSKRFRNKNRNIALIIITILIGITGITIRTEEFQMVNFNVADFLLSPFVGVFTFLFLRKRYYLKYNTELTFYWFSWYDPVERRKQNWFDVAVNVLPILIAGLLPVFIYYILELLSQIN